MATVETIETIKARHPVREAFAGCSSGAGGSGYANYYSTKGHAVNAFDARLQTYDLWFDRDDVSGFDGNEGRRTLAIVNDFDRCVGYAVLSWYRMPSGNYEFVGYIT